MWVLVTQSCRTRCDPMDYTVHQALLSMGFSRQGYWSGLPFLFPGDLPNPGIEPRSPALQLGALSSELQGKPLNITWVISIVFIQIWSRDLFSPSAGMYNIIKILKYLRTLVGKKVGLKLNIQKTKIMASGPITLWQIDGETMETVSHFIFLGSKITADGDCSHEIKRRLLLGRKLWKT